MNVITIKLKGHIVTEFNKKPCPLCGREAEWIPVHFGSKRKFKCPKCKIFLLSTLLEETMSEISEPEKRKISNKSASCEDNMMLHIYKKDNIIHLDCVPIGSWT